MKRERDEANLRVEGKERELTELRREVNNVIDKKRRLEQELERLRQHLLAVEEGYTQEALSTEERERDLRKKLQITEEALRVSSTQHSTASQEATAHKETLQRKVQQLSEQRDQLLDKLTKVTNDYQSQTTALDNLTMVLEGFQRTQENGLKLAEKDYRERLSREKAIQSGMEEEIRALKESVESANEGLAAASRLSEQLDKKSQIITTLKQEIKLRDELLKKAQDELSSASNSNAGKVDKSLVKNLVVGYASADESKRPDVLKVIATVLDFNGEERQRTGLDGASNTGWLRGWLGGGSPAGRASQVQASTGLDQSLAQAFVQFLETESAPKTPLKLPVSEMADELLGGSRRSSVSAGGGTPPPAPAPGQQQPDPSSTSRGRSAMTPSPASALGRQSPNAFVAANNPHHSALPTFSVNRSSSAILKHVLHEEQPPPMPSPSNPPPQNK